jgi:predicted anti-sigma-YlaC factor YlaD
VTCRECADFLSDYLEGELTDEVRVVFERHLSRCPNCEIYLSQFRTTLQAERCAFGEEAEVSGSIPEELVQAILASRKA